MIKRKATALTQFCVSADLYPSLNDRLAEQSPKTHVILSGAAQSAAESKNLRIIVAAVLIGSVIRLRCPAEASPDMAGSLPVDRGTCLCPASSATGGAGQRGLRLPFDYAQGRSG